MTGLYRLLFLGICYVVMVDIAAAANDTCKPSFFDTYYPGDTFRHPQDKCVICECCEGGVYTCVRKECPRQPCGILKQTKYTGDGCCAQCCDECAGQTCPQLQCEYQAYPANSCCKTCGCNYNGTVVPIGPVGHACENCECHANGTVTCNRPACPSSGLKCVNPTFVSGSNCTWTCPTGEYTCRRGKTLIPAGTVVRIKNKICACSTLKFYPRAFCANVQEIFGRKRFSTLWYGKCLEKYQGSDIVQNPLKYLVPQMGPSI